MKYAVANVLPLHGGCCGREGEVGGGAKRGRERGGEREREIKGEGREEIVFITPFTAQATV